MQKNSIISIKNLNKTYATGFVALKNINLEIKKGEIFGLLGPNGAGKTTLINIVSGVVKPSSGTILSKTIGSREARSGWFPKR
jgi:ABC-2 type transport system ATP-binding protein